MQDQGKEPLLVSRSGAAGLLGIHANSIDNLRRRGELSVVRILTGKPMFDVDEIKQLIRDRKRREGGAA